MTPPTYNHFVTHATHARLGAVSERGKGGQKSTGWQTVDRTGVFFLSPQVLEGGGWHG